MSWGVALRNAVGLGLGGIPSLLNAPPYAKLAFNFLSGVLDPRITFSRTSNATLIGSDGTLQYAPHNLLTYSEQFDNAAWTKNNVAVTANAETAPDGTTTADLLTTTTAIDPYLGSTTVSGTTTFTHSVYVKQGGVDPSPKAQIRIITFATATEDDQLYFEFATKTFTFGAGSSVSSYGYEQLPNGWFRLWVTNSAAVGQTGTQLRVRPAPATNGSIINGQTLLAWGAQLNVGALQPYYSTTVKNLLGYSQEFDNAAWTKNNSTVTANTAVAPDGSVTADKLVENTASSTHPAFQAASVVSGTRYTFSVYVKAGERSFCRVEASGAAMTAGAVNVNLTTGATSNDGSVVASSATLIGNGWYRIQVTATAGSTGSGNFVVYPATALGGFNYTGDGTSGIYVWGAQFSDSASLDPYVYNPGAAPTNTAYYGPRFDYDPVTLAPNGLLIEEQRTNSLRNNTMVGAVVGTPGTDPTNWISATPAGAITSKQIVGVGAEDGIQYIDVRYTTSGAVAFNAFVLEQPTQIVAANGQTWASSVYIKLAGGSLASASITHRLMYRAVAGAAVAFNDITVVPTTASLKSQRSFNIATAANATIERVTNQVLITTSDASDITLRIGLPQLELGAFATSVIPTTTTALTRAADVASVTGANFSNWYNPVEGTLVTTTLAINQTFPPNRYVSTMDDGTTNNIIGAYIATDLNSASFVVNGGVAVYQQVITTVSNTLPNSIAVTYKANDFMSAANGVLGIPDTSGAIPVVNKITFGNRSDGARPLNGHIRSFKYYPTRLSNGQLQALTK